MTALLRKRRERARRAAGLAVATIEYPEDDTVAALIEAKYLHPAFADDPEAVRRAIEQAWLVLVVKGHA